MEEKMQVIYLKDLVAKKRMEARKILEEIINTELIDGVITKEEADRLLADLTYSADE